MTNVAGPLIQNFSVVVNEDTVVNCDIDPDSGVSLLGATIYWSVFEQKYTIPIGTAAVLRKVSDHGLQVTDDLLLKFAITIGAADTIGMTPGNYYHETQVVDVDGNTVTVNCGIMTLKSTTNRDFTIPA